MIAINWLVAIGQLRPASFEIHLLSMPNAYCYLAPASLASSLGQYSP